MHFRKETNWITAKRHDTSDPDRIPRRKALERLLWSGHRCRLNKAGDEPILYRKRQKLTKDKWTEWQRKKSVRSKKNLRQWTMRNCLLFIETYEKDERSGVVKIVEQAKKRFEKLEAEEAALKI